MLQKSSPKEILDLVIISPNPLSLSLDMNAHVLEQYIISMSN